MVDLLIMFSAILNQACFGLVSTNLVSRDQVVVCPWPQGNCFNSKFLNALRDRPRGSVQDNDSNQCANWEVYTAWFTVSIALLGIVPVLIRPPSPQNLQAALPTIKVTLDLSKSVAVLTTHTILRLLKSKVRSKLYLMYTNMF